MSSLATRALALGKNLLATAIGLAGGLVVIEAGLWVAGLPRSGPFFQEFAHHRFKLMCYREKTSGDLALDLRQDSVRRRVAAGLAATDFAATWGATPFCNEIVYNSAGFREREIARKAPGTRRIGVIGDSYAYGHGLPSPAPFPRQLEALLAGQLGAGRFEVLNLGVGAADFPELANLGERALRDMDLDVLVYAYFMNDGTGVNGLGPAAGMTTMMRAGWQHASHGPGRVSLGVRPSGFPRSGRIIKRFFEQQRLSKATAEYYRWIHSDEQWPKVGRYIVRLQASSDARNVRFVVVPLPIAFRLGRDYPFADLHARVLGYLRSNGIESVDVLPRLVARAADTLALHPDDLHPTARYHRIVAQALFDELFRPD